jgi:signal transduction histidine kinase
MTEGATRSGHWLPVWWRTGRRTPLWWVVLVGGSTLLAADSVLTFERHTSPARFLVMGNAGQIAEFTVGLLFWMWRPRNVVGPLLALWPLLALSNDVPSLFDYSQWSWTVFVALTGLYGAVYVNAVLLFPSGRLRSRYDAVVIALVYAVLWLHLALPVLLFGGFPGAPPFLHSLLDVGHSWSGLGTWLNIWAVGTIATIVVVDCLLVARVVRAAPGARRRLMPLVGVFVVLWTFVFVFTSLVTLGVVHETQWALYPFTAVYGLSALAAAVGLAAVRRKRGDVADLVVQLDSVRSGDVRERLAQVLGDPSVVMAVRSAERDAWIDESEREVSIPVDGSRGVTYVGDGRGVVVHDRDLLDQPRLVEAAGSAALLALENDRLQARLRAQMAAVHASRTRLVEGDDRERRRLQRDLRARVELQLLELQAGLSTLSGRLDATGDSLLAKVRDELTVALSELDDLAHGIHPALLVEAGLAGALQTLAARTSVPVDVRSCPGRLPESVETAAYFLVAEALANVARYSRATRASVEVQAGRGLARIEIRDDGIGGADPDGGSGLRGLSDRVSALGGKLRVNSPPEGGTTLLAEIPCPS